MGWCGSGGDGAATVGTFYFFGGLIQIVGSLLEWIIGNAFIYVVFGSFMLCLVHLCCVWFIWGFLACVCCYSYAILQRGRSIYLWCHNSSGKGSRNKELSSQSRYICLPTAT
ncbi:hypothetical protein V8C42DRAFT_324199 [Trichoderma barbatum]